MLDQQPKEEDEILLTFCAWLLGWLVGWLVDSLVWENHLKCSQVPARREKKSERDLCADVLRGDVAFACCFIFFFSALLALPP
jgi:hypothetical protein